MITLIRLSILSVLLSWFSSDKTETQLSPATETENACMCDPVRDRQALIALYNATNGENWTYANTIVRNAGNAWQFDQPMSTWHGVVLSDEGCVEQILLENNKLNGTIPVELGNLTSLNALLLSDNELSGMIPSELGNLTNLVNLYLSDNELSGSIPVELGDLISLNRLFLDNNKLSSSIPVELGNLTNLTNLWLGSNNLSGPIPNELGNLTELLILLLADNNLSGTIPAELGNLPNLSWLVLSGNNLSGCLPPELLTNCGILYDFTINPQLPWQGDSERFCNGEEQRGAPCDDEDANTTNDQIQADCSCAGTAIVVNECRMRDSLILVDLYNSTNGANWTNTWDLNAPMETWDGITLANGCVSEIRLFFRGLNGVLPPELGNLSSIEVLRIYNEFNIRGSIPAELGQLTTLKNLAIFANRNLTGEIPKELGQLINLEFLDLSQNNLNGTIPIELGQLINLKTLFIYVNRNLTGEIPIELGQLINLERLSLDQNALTGSIPPELGDLAELQILDLFRNQLSGSIPSELGNLSSLEALYLDDNQLSGFIPESLVNLLMLSQFYLHDNNLTGCFPNELLSHCGLGFNANPIGPDNLVGYNFTNNPQLPWQGDFERFCNGEDQIGAPCDDGDDNTQNEVIQADCSCSERLTPMITLNQGDISCENATVSVCLTVENFNTISGISHIIHWNPTILTLSNTDIVSNNIFNSNFVISSDSTINFGWGSAPARDFIDGETLYCLEFDIISTIPITGTSIDQFSLSERPSDFTGPPNQVIINFSSTITDYIFNNALIMPTNGNTTGIGNPCDDNNPNTDNDQIQADCSCAGEIEECELAVSASSSTEILCYENRFAFLTLRDTVAGQTFQWFESGLELEGQTEAELRVE